MRGVIGHASRSFAILGISWLMAACGISSGKKIDTLATFPNDRSAAEALITSESAAIATTTILGDRMPAVPADSEGRSVEVGMKFQALAPAQILGMRFYKGAGNSGTHVGKLYSRSGTLLASATFTNETASGWQSMMFNAPVTLQANTTYVVSYFAPKGHYAGDNQGLSISITDPTGLLKALASGTDGGNGVYRYTSSGGFPSKAFKATNYYVDVIAAPVVAATLTPTPTPVPSVAPSPYPSVAPSPSPSPIASTETALGSRTPPNAAETTDTASVEVGVKFKASVAGKITGIRFYRAVDSSSGFKASLWSASGTLLGSASVPAGSAIPGYVQANFASPISIEAGTTYVASYFAPQGQYAYETSGLSSSVTSGSLTLLSNSESGGNGVYSYNTSSTFPSRSYQASNYFVDVVFQAASGSTTTTPTPVPTSSNYTLTVTKSGSGTVTGPGISCGSDCSETLASGSAVSLSAVPASGYTFSGWSGACSGTGSCSLTMNSSKSVTATFAPVTSSSGGNWYVTPNGSGNGTSWSSAWKPSTVVWSSIQPGDTIWMAGGTYSSGFTLRKSGTASGPISIKRVTANDTVATQASGWSASFDSQVLISAENGFVFDTSNVGSYLIVDGRVPKGIAVRYKDLSWASGAIYFYAGGMHDIRFANVDLAGPGGTTPYFYQGDNSVIGMRPMINGGGAIYNFTLADSELHGGPNLVYNLGPNHDFLFHHVKFYDNGSSNDAIHANMVYTGGENYNWTFAHCDFSMWQVEGINLYQQTNHPHYIYGSIFHHPMQPGARAFWLANESGSPTGPLYLYNNTFAGVNITLGESRASMATSNSQARNNIYYNSSWYSGSRITDSANNLTTSTSPFVSSTDFHLKAATVPGTPLASPYNIDPDGKTRGADGNWDIGAFEFDSAGAPTN